MTPERNFDEGAAQRIKKEKWCWKLLSWTTSFPGPFSLALELGRPTCKARGKRPRGRLLPFSVIIFRRTLSSDVFERCTSTGSGLFAQLGLDFEKNFEQLVSLRVKTLSTTNLVVSRHIKKKKTYFWLTRVAQNRPCLNSLLTSNVRPVNGTPIMVITGVRL